MRDTTFGIELAKNVFQAHGVDASGYTFVKKQLKRDQLLTYFVEQAPTTLEMEA